MKQLLIATVLGVVTVAISPVHAQEGDKERAQALLREGNELLAKKQYAPALAKFEAAYEVFPSPAILLNIGTALRDLGRNADAANAYARWIRAKVAPQRLAEVEEALTELDKAVARVELAVSEPGARVVVDGRPIAAGMREFRLEPGAHTITAEKEGFTPARQQIQVSAGQRQTIELTLERAGGGSSDAKPEDATPENTEPTETDPDPTVTKSSGGSGTTLKIAGLSTAAVGLVALGVGVKFGLDAKNLNDELEAVDSSQGWTPELLAKQDEGDSAETKFIVFTAVGGAAIIAGGVMSYLGFTAGGGDESSLALAPSVSSESLGWVVSGRF